MCHGMVPLQMLHIVTLTHIFKIAKFVEKYKKNTQYLGNGES